MFLLKEKISQANTTELISKEFVQTQVNCLLFHLRDLLSVAIFQAFLLHWGCILYLCSLSL